MTQNAQGEAKLMQPLSRTTLLKWSHGTLMIQSVPEQMIQQSKTVNRSIMIRYDQGKAILQRNKLNPSIMIRCDQGQTIQLHPLMRPQLKRKKLWLSQRNQSKRGT